MTDHPIVDTSTAQEIARDLVVIPNQDVDLVPNIGLIGGSQAVLVIDTGLGPRNAEQVLKFATEYAAGRRLYLTTTHFHPEHAFGATAFAGEATYLVNSAQATDLSSKWESTLAMFNQLGPAVARELDGVSQPTPDIVYTDTHQIDLGGRVVQLRPTGRAHSNGDQLIVVPDVSAVFTGDLVETGQFAIFPWFPPYETDVSGVAWIKVMEQLTASNPTIVVPGHGAVGDTRLLVDVRDYLTELRDETWVRRDSALPVETIAEEVRALMIERHPDWRLPEWIDRGVGCLCSEY
ncbi:MBL fold metallo-hydrolase [Kribbella sp. NPDC056951]|uniref:MBL fold metallo-hydrolase n=1 Tax=Kribbella sp. NPDC056951 TaxID=3345978 RepID=UPI0036455E6F